MPTNLSSFRRRAGLVCAGAALAFPGIRAAAGNSSQTDAFPAYESYIKLSGVAPWMSGDTAAFATRTGTPNTGAGGIEDFFYTKDVSNNTTVTADGRALAGSEDYLASINLTKDGTGSIDAGYKRFRTFYDGVGGFFPTTAQFESLNPELLHVDRGAFWATVTLAKPDRPVFTISFRDETRIGQKDSSEWGLAINPSAVITNGALVGTAAPANTVAIVPNVLTMNEHHDILEAKMTAKVGKVTETLKATLDTVNNDDFRDYVKYPNSTVTADPQVMVHDDEETVKSTNFRLMSQTEVAFNEHIALDVGLSYYQLANTNGGNWITPAYSSTANAIYYGAETAGNIYGWAKLYDYVGNVFLKYTPNKNWDAEIGFRDESNVVTNNGGFMTTAVATGATSINANTITTADDVTYSHDTDHIATPEVSLQYLGINRLSLYGSFDARSTHGYQHWVNPYAATTTTTGVTTTAAAPIANVFYQDANQDYDDAKLGANWNASSQFTVRAEVYRKDHENTFTGDNQYVGTGSYGGLYITGYSFTGLKLSVNFRPVPQVSFNTRYQPQSGNYSVTGNSDTGGNGTDVTSGKARTQMIAESVNWTPSQRVYLQGNVNLVYNYIQTAYPIVIVSTSPYVPTPFQNANNNYVTCSALCGFVLDKRTDAQIQGYWTRAGDYNPQIAAGGQPYGSSFLEESVTAGLKRKLTDRLIGEGKAGYLERTDPTTGGFTNYRGPLVYVGLTYSL